MRSLILFMIFLVLAVLSLTMPSIGVLTWAWIAIMSPHRLTWDFTYTLQLNLVIVVSVIQAMNSMIVTVAAFIGRRFGSRATTHAMKVMMTIARLS